VIVAWYAHVILFHPISPLYSNDTTEYMMPTMDSSCPLSHNIGIYWDIHIIHLLCHYIPFYLHDILIISSSYSVIFHCTSHCIPMKFWWNCKWHIRMRFQSYWMFISPSMWYIPMTYEWYFNDILMELYLIDIPMIFLATIPFYSNDIPRPSSHPRPQLFDSVTSWSSTVARGSSRRRIPKEPEMGPWIPCKEIMQLWPN